MAFSFTSYIGKKRSVFKSVPIVGSKYGVKPLVKPALPKLQPKPVSVVVTSFSSNVPGRVTAALATSKGAIKQVQSVLDASHKTLGKVKQVLGIH